jgi:hypothetical protein
MMMMMMMMMMQLLVCIHMYSYYSVIQYSRDVGEGWLACLCQQAQ